MSGLPGWPFSLLSRARLCQQKSGDELLPQQATDAVMHNIQHSFLHRLPLDILYYLATQHTPRGSADFLALVASTRALRFSPIIRASTPPLHHASRAFLRRLRRDDFARACEQQQTAPSSSTRLSARVQLGLRRVLRSAAAAIGSSSSSPVLHPCAGCQALHPPSHFSATQLARAPDARRCRGSDGVLRVCPHLAFTYAQMRDVQERARAEARPDTFFLFDIECGVCPRAGMRSYPRGPTFGDGYQREVFRIIQILELDGLVVEGGGCDGGDGGGGGGGGDRGRLVVSERTDFTLDVTLRVLRTVAERHDIFLCNHIRLGEPQTFVTIFMAPHRRVSVISIHECRVCRASAVLRDCLFTGINLKIERNFTVNSPTDKQWLAQIQGSEENHTETVRKPMAG